VRIQFLQVILLRRWIQQGWWRCLRHGEIHESHQNLAFSSRTISRRPAVRKPKSLQLAQTRCLFSLRSSVPQLDVCSSGNYIQHRFLRRLGWKGLWKLRRQRTRLQCVRRRHPWRLQRLLFPHQLTEPLLSWRFRTHRQPSHHQASRSNSTYRNMFTNVCKSPVPHQVRGSKSSWTRSTERNKRLVVFRRP